MIKLINNSSLNRIERLDFQPLTGFASKHVQTILPVYLSPGIVPFSKPWIVKLDQSDSLSCEVSEPLGWKKNGLTVVLIHGLGGSHSSNYMIRMTRKLCLKGIKVVRVNLRGCGSGKGLSKLPYHGGNSEDVLKVLNSCKEESPDSQIILIGFSLGGNIALKLVGELGKKADSLLKSCIAVCPPLDLFQSSQIIQEKRHWLYQRHYLTTLVKQTEALIGCKPSSLYELDEMITAPLWGFKGAFEYYQECSSLQFIPKITHPTRVLLTEDDPFIDHTRVEDLSLSESVNVFITKKGGHMGFLGKSLKGDSVYWMDQLLQEWIEEDTIAG